MRGYLRNKNRKQSQGDQLFQEQRFDAGWINDLPASDLPKGGMALLENFVGFPEYLEGRSGSQKYSDTALPGSGAIYSIAQHPTTKKWVMHRGQKLYYADSAQVAWTELLDNGASGYDPTVNGDAAGQLAYLNLSHGNYSNSSSGTYYWNLTNSASTRTLDIYKDAAKTQLVASGSRVGDGYMYLHQQNNSGLGGTVTVTYTVNDTDAGNTFYGPFLVQAFGYSVESHLEPIGNDFFLFVGEGAGAGVHVFIDLTNNWFTYLYGGNNTAIVDVGVQDAATPYGYRYLFTYSRILDPATGAIGATLNRTTGNLVFESPSNANAFDAQKDYGETWLADPISSGAPNTIIATFGGSLTNSPYGTQSAAHFTHLSLYRTMDIGVAGVDPVSGSGNNREIYVWVGDYDFSHESIVDSKSDDDIRAAFSAGFSLKSRFWTTLPEGAAGTIANNFIYCGNRGDNKISYGQLTEKRFLGYYNPAYQFFNLDDGIQYIAKSPDMITFICSNKTYISNPNSYFDAGGLAIASVFVLNHLTVASENIGVTDWGSFAKMDNAFVAHCTDHTIRIWNSSYWSDDIASRRVNQIVRQMAIGSVGVYGAGAYYLFYRTDTGQTNNNLCLRYGFSRESGFGWSKVSGSAWPVVSTYRGASQIIDANNLQRIIVTDIVDGFSYWIETFTAYTGSSTTKVFKDKVGVSGTGGTNIICTARFREFTASDESMDLFHKESYIYDRPYDEATGYPTGFSRTLKAYTDGSTTAAATITAAPAKGDLQFFDKVSGNRIQMEVQFATSGARLTGIATLCDVFDRAAIGSRPSDGSAAAAQLVLSSNMQVWVTRPYSIMNRITGIDGTVNGTAPTATTGPDGKDHALLFDNSGIGSRLVIPNAQTYTHFYVHFWYSQTNTSYIKAIVYLQGSGNPGALISFTSATNMSISIGINPVVNISISSIASNWHDFWVFWIAGVVRVYQNGAFVSSALASDLSPIGGVNTIFNYNGFGMKLYDLRVYSSPTTSAISYYYADVNTTLQGNKVLPLA